MKKKPGVPYLFPRQIVGRQQTSNKADVHFEHRNFSVLQQPKQRKEKCQILVIARLTGCNRRERDKRCVALKTRQSIRAHSLAAGSEWDPRLSTQPRSTSLQLTKLQTFLQKKKQKKNGFCSSTRFIMYAVNCKLLQNKLNRSRKVTQTAVTPVAAVGGGS